MKFDLKTWLIKAINKFMKIPYYTLGLGLSLNLWILRNRIDKIDDEIYNLVLKRLEYAALTRQYKNSIYDEHRESQVIDRLKKKNLLKEDVVDDIWKQLIKHGKKVQLDMEEEKENEQ